MRQTAVELSILLASICLYKEALCWPDGQSGWTAPSEDSWNYWWSYSGVSGPSYWGLLNSDWFMCDKGRRQSPINIETSSLVYDQHLGPLRADNNLISGVLCNDGHAILFASSNSRLLMAGGKREKMDKLGQHNNTLSRRNAPAIAAQKLEPLNGLEDLSNSVELSIDQNERLDLVAGDLDKLAAESVENDDASDSSEANGDRADDSSTVHFTGAGMVYPYRFEALYIRFGLEKKSGSEHSIDSRAFDAELQVFAYNSLLYKNYADAFSKPHGLMAISILVDILQTNETKIGEHGGSKLNGQLESLLSRLGEIKHRGSSTIVRAFNLSALLPEADSFVTYEGSLTVPGCHESVNWLVLNKPLYMRQSHIDALRSISADEPLDSPTGTLIAGNIRPLQPVNNRPIRTNIRPSGTLESLDSCQKFRTKLSYRRAVRTNDAS